MSLLPTTLSTNATGPEEVEGGGATVVGLQDESDVFSVLAAEMAREILLALYEDPAAASELATEVGTSLQNAQYHLANLSDAGVVEAVGAKYSSRGREMTVYAPADNPLTMVLGDAECLDSCREVLTNPDTE